MIITEEEDLVYEALLDTNGMFPGARGLIGSASCAYGCMHMEYITMSLEVHCFCVDMHTV